MKKLICKKVYDTETATVIARAAFGEFGDPTGYEEILFQAPEGHFFLYGIGGEQSPYPAEKISQIRKDKAEAWAAQHQ